MPAEQATPSAHAPDLEPSGDLEPYGHGDGERPASRPGVLPRTRSWIGRRLLLAAWLVAMLLAAIATLRLAAHDAAFPLVALNAFSAWLYLPAWIVGGGALLARRQVLAVVAGVLCALHIVWLGPAGFFASAPPEAVASAPTFRLMSANLLMSNEDTAGIVGEVLRVRPDVLLVQELAPQWQRVFDAPAVMRLLPHRRSITRPDSFGIGIYSRFPIDAEVFTIEDLPQIRADLLIGGRPLRVYNFHSLPPRNWEYTAGWNRMMGDIVRRLGNERGPILVGGDLNATPQARWYQTLTSGRLRGAHEDRGRGFANTWPNGLWPLPPLRLDHLLLSPEVACRTIREGEGRGSDHRPLVAQLALIEDR